MPHFNVGVTYDNIDVPTKKKLKEIVTNNPADLFVYGTAQGFPGVSRGYLTELEELGTNDTLVVAGPNPYTARKWYANIRRTTDGTFQVT